MDKSEKKKTIIREVGRILIVLAAVVINVIFINIIRGFYVGGAFFAFLEAVDTEYGIMGYWLEFLFFGISWFPLYFFMLPPLNIIPMELIVILLGVICREKEVKKGFLKIYSIIMLISLVINLLTSFVYLIMGIIMACNPDWTEFFRIKSVNPTTFAMSIGLFAWVVFMLILYLIFFIIDKNRNKAKEAADFS